MKLCEYDEHVRELRNATRRKCRAAERGDERALCDAMHEIEQREYALGRLVEGQQPVTRAMCEDAC